MFKKNLAFVVTVLITLIVTGCSSVKVANSLNGQNFSQNSTPIANIVSSNYGCYLLSCIPIVAGDSNDPDSWHLFQDTVTVAASYNTLMKQSSKLGATKTINIRSEEKWYPNPYSYGLIWTKEVEVTGDAIK